MRVAVPIKLTKEERRQLLKFSKGRSTPARMVLRAKIMLAAAAGKLNKEIAEDLGTLPKTVGLWRNRFARAADRRHRERRPGSGPAADDR